MKKIGVCLIIAVSFFFSMVSSNVFAETDITDKIEIIKSRMMFDRANSINYFDVSIKNISQDLLKAPFQIVIDDISTTDVEIINKDGITKEGKPFFKYYDIAEEISPGETTISKRWEFSNPMRKRFTYSYSVKGNIVFVAGIDESGGIISPNSIPGLEFFEISVNENIIEENSTIKISTSDIETVTIDENDKVVTPIVDLSSSDNQIFNDELTIKMPIFYPSEDNDFDVNLVRIYYIDENGKMNRLNRKYIRVIDSENMIITYETNHFSKWFGLIKTTSDLQWSDSTIYSDEEGCYYEDAIDWLKNVKLNPEFWNTIIKTNGDAVVVDENQISNILEWDSIKTLWKDTSFWGDDSISSKNLDKVINFYTPRPDGTKPTVRELINALIYIGEFINLSNDSFSSSSDERIAKTCKNISTVIDAGHLIYKLSTVGLSSIPTCGITYLLSDAVFFLMNTAHLAIGEGLDALWEMDKIINVFEDYNYSVQGQGIKPGFSVSTGYPYSDAVTFFTNNNVQFYKSYWAEFENTELSSSMELYFNLFEFKSTSAVTKSSSYPDGFFPIGASEFYGFILSDWDMAPIKKADLVVIIKRGPDTVFRYAKSNLIVGLGADIYRNITYAYPKTEDSQDDDISFRLVAWDKGPLYLSPWYTVKKYDYTTDSDTDGVPDFFDQCPGTPEGVEVDDSGCPKDDDADGVPNYLDACPGTVANETVNNSGCSYAQEDSDNDGTPNGVDKFPDDFNEWDDSDSDGIGDNADQCDATPFGYEINSDGCSPLELDDDGDGYSELDGDCEDDPGKVYASSIYPGAKEIYDNHDNDCDGIIDEGLSGMDVAVDTNLNKLQVVPFFVEPEDQVKLQAAFYNLSKNGKAINIIAHWEVRAPDGSLVDEKVEIYPSIPVNGTTGIQTSSLTVNSIEGVWEARIRIELDDDDDQTLDYDDDIKNNQQSLQFFVGSDQGFDEYIRLYDVVTLDEPITINDIYRISLLALSSNDNDCQLRIQLIDPETDVVIIEEERWFDDNDFYDEFNFGQIVLTEVGKSSEYSATFEYWVAPLPNNYDLYSLEKDSSASLPGGNLEYLFNIPLDIMPDIESDSVDAIVRVAEDGNKVIATINDDSNYIDFDKVSDGVYRLEIPILDTAQEQGPYEFWIKFSINGIRFANKLKMEILALPVDSDGDGIFDEFDAFPDDPNEWDDTDSDGVGDNSDAFPKNPSEWFDSDLDGYGDNCDHFPLDQNEWADSDLDGIGDNGDKCQLIPNPDQLDSNGDGVGDACPSPKILGSTSNTGNYWYSYFIVSGEYAYAVSDEILSIYDVGNPNAPTVAGSVSLSSIGIWEPGISINGDYLYVYPKGLCPNPVNVAVIDIAVPETPNLLKVFQFSADADITNFIINNGDISAILHKEIDIYGSTMDCCMGCNLYENEVECEFQCAGDSSCMDSCMANKEAMCYECVDSWQSIFGSDVLSRNGLTLEISRSILPPFDDIYITTDDSGYSGAAPIYEAVDIIDSRFLFNDGDLTTFNDADVMMGYFGNLASLGSIIGVKEECDTGIPFFRENENSMSGFGIRILSNKTGLLQQEIIFEYSLSEEYENYLDEHDYDGWSFPEDLYPYRNLGKTFFDDDQIYLTPTPASYQLPIISIDLEDFSFGFNNISAGYCYEDIFILNSNVFFINKDEIDEVWLETMKLNGLQDISFRKKIHTIQWPELLFVTSDRAYVLGGDDESNTILSIIDVSMINNEFPLSDAFSVEQSSDADPFEISFNCNAHDEDGEIYSYTMYYGDGTSETKSEGSFEHLYENEGTYESYCMVVDNKGGYANSEKITINLDEQGNLTVP